MSINGKNNFTISRGQKINMSIQTETKKKIILVVSFVLVIIVGVGIVPMFIDPPMIIYDPLPLQSSSKQIKQYTLEELQQFALDEINKYRIENGVEPVVLSNYEVAQEYANEMLETQCTGHISKDGLTPQKRYEKSGITHLAVGENVASGGWRVENQLISFKNRDPMIEISYHVGEWMTSIGHRENMLDPTWKSASIGIAYDSTFFFIVGNFENLKDPRMNYIEIVNNAKYCY